jgi:tetratricopeptide (TPR) repeat protein
MKMRRSLATVAGLLLAAGNAVAGDPPLTLSHAGCAAAGDPVEPALLARKIALRGDIGAVHQPITASSAAVQGYYDQGLTLLHHYVWVDAARSFHEALRLDPDCAMCWMGLARAEQGAERPEAARAAIASATRLAPKATAKEQVFIALRAQQVEAQDAEGAEQAKQHDAYRAALDQALASYPDDAELWLLRGNAEEPGPWGRGQFGGAASIAFYETALVRSPDHLGAHHYLTHSFENIAHPAEAAQHGKVYADAAPGVAHAQHMLGHVLPRLGRWDEALVQFRKADAIEIAYARELGLRPGDDWHHLHNLQLLGYTYLRLGDNAQAEATFRRAFDTPSRQPYRGTAQASLAELYLLWGRLEDALTVARALQVPTRTPAARTAGAVVEGEALLAMGKTKESKACSARAKQLLDTSVHQLPGYQSRYVELFVRPYVDQLDTEIALREDSPAAAEASILAVADALSMNPRFDAWGEGLFRLERIAADARRAGRQQLAADIEVRMKRIDPDYKSSVVSSQLSVLTSDH